MKGHTRSWARAAKGFNLDRGVPAALANCADGWSSVHPAVKLWEG